MELAIIDFFKEYVIWGYAVAIAGITEIWKRCSKKVENKWYLKIDKENIVGFNLRTLTFGISFIVGLVIVLIEKDATLTRDLLITFCLTVTAYEYIYKAAIKKFKINNYTRG